ncbi:Hsp20/alpha crystallin family protein [Piscinibacter sakaiensis]|uniref:Putative heat shock protein n=1 Tax=Piscinibacter sakaiensis TaxID=1547922 RepID=A0A0K8P0F2_PISS1|nr:Hsp20/alpha crystallin family protein [Piscinibacter sakaiensis]GAP36111.1 putative heat shock protein [Piscinibacter sakaiensis]
MNTTAVTTPKDERSTRQGSAQDPALLPPVDVVEDSTGITLYADMPGVPRDQLNLRVERDTLTLEGEIALPVPQGMQPGHAEVQLARYRRTFTLSKELDAEKINAELSQGVLRVRIPKAEHAQPRRIQVSVA